MIALNVSRARLTVLGFAQAVILFAFGIFVQIEGGERSGVIWAHFTASVPLFIAFGLAICSSALFLISQTLNRDGNSEVWTFSFAEIVMYVALGQTLSGVLQEFVIAFSATLKAQSLSMGASSPIAAEFSRSFANFQLLTHWFAATVWCLIVYVAPFGSVMRIQMGWKQKWVLIGIYITLLIVVFGLSAHAFYLTELARGNETSVSRLFVQQFWQPALWNR